jgi:hypothetical protein
MAPLGLKLRSNSRSVPSEEGRCGLSILLILFKQI